MITIKDVAKRAGVSISTVSRVINHIPNVTEEAAAAVNRAIQELGYQPNVIARSLQSGRSHLFGMLVPQLDHPFFRRLVQAVEQRCTEHDYRLILCVSDGDAAKEREFLQMLHQNRVDGILIDTRDPDLGFLARYHIPVVVIESEIEGVPCVTSDSSGGGVLAARMLQEAGVRRPFVLRRNAVDSDLPTPGNLRAESFAAECERLGLPCQILTPPPGFNDSKEVCISYVTELLRSHPEMDGLFANSDVTAAWVRLACSRLGVRIPEDLKLLGFDGVDAAEYLDISTIVQPITEMGTQAVDILLASVNGADPALQTVLPVRAVSRGSTAGVSREVR